MVKQKKKISSLEKTIDETYKIPDKRGNGILTFSVNPEIKGKFRYSLAYINTAICNKDNGRVLGYDNDHGYHHRHYMGKIEPVEFKSFAEITKCFEDEWKEIHEKFQKQKKS